MAYIFHILFTIAAILIVAQASILNTKEYNTVQNAANEAYRATAAFENMPEMELNESQLTGNKVEFTKERLLEYLLSVSGSKTISGLNVPYGGTDFINKASDLIQTLTGELPGMLVAGLPELAAEEDEWDSFIDTIISYWKKGSFVSLLWEDSNHPLSTVDIFQSTTNATLNDIRWIDLITDGGDLNNGWKLQLDLLAPHLQKIQSAGVIAMCTLLPNINDQYFLWGGRSGVNGSSKLFKLTHDYLSTRYGLHSFAWTWQVSLNWNMTDIAQFWPGSDYVDTVAVYMGSFNNLTASDYEYIKNIAHGKPMSMDDCYYVPTPQLLARQPQWSWFTLWDNPSNDAEYYKDDDLNATLHLGSVLNRGQIEFFKSA